MRHSCWDSSRARIPVSYPETNKCDYNHKQGFFSVPKELQLYATLVSILASMFVASSENQNAVTGANPMREEDLRKPCQRGKDAGVTAVEYTIMVVLIALGVAGFGSGINGAVTAVFSRFVSVISLAI